MLIVTRMPLQLEILAWKAVYTALNKAPEEEFETALHCVERTQEKFMLDQAQKQVEVETEYSTTYRSRATLFEQRCTSSLIPFFAYL